HVLGGRGGRRALARLRRGDPGADGDHARGEPGDRRGAAGGPTLASRRRDRRGVVMRWLRSFALFWYDFVVGDDPTVAIAVVVALGAPASRAPNHEPAWWVLPLAALGLLVVSVTREARAARRRE